jgi:4-amino-4-deoxy-L-arabinose transferase-like glycosyltransferase
VCAIVLGLFALRLIVAAFMPLSNDEILYWRYSKHLGFGFLDHPALNPAMIKIGTLIAGDTPLGIRLMAVLSGLPATWAVWRATTLLTRDARTGLYAALFFSLTFAMSIGGMIATSDSAVMLTSALILWTVVKLIDSQRGVWWLAIGAAIGFGMYAKYTTAFLGFGLVFWLALAPSMRRWFFSPWPYFGAALSLAIFAPVLAWNAEREWASFAYQSSRMAPHHLDLRFVGEYLGSQLVLATPAVFILAVLGLTLKPPTSDDQGPRLMLACLILPLLVLFFVQSFIERVQGNWPMAVYPAIAAAAALGWRHAETGAGAAAAWARGSSRIAAPFTIVLTTLILTHAVFGYLPLKRDPVARELSQGFEGVAVAAERQRLAIGAKAILSANYSTAVLLSYYGRPDGEYHQISERVRWSNEPPPDPALFEGPILFASRQDPKMEKKLRKRFGEVEQLETVRRVARGQPYETYDLWRIAKPIGPVLNPMFPIRLKEVIYEDL